MADTLEIRLMQVEYANLSVRELREDMAQLELSRIAALAAGEEAAAKAFAETIALLQGQERLACAELSQAAHALTTNWRLSRGEVVE